MTVAAREPVKLEKRLVLHNWVNSLLGYGSTAELLRDLRDAAEGFDSQRRSYVYHNLYSRSDKIRLPMDDLERYDDNI